jgi:type I restriction enzyme S subunit
MINDLKQYPAYRYSGAPWLGEIPEHWQMQRAKSLFLRMDRPVRQEDEVVTCFRDGIVTLRKNRRVRGFTESLQEIGYQGIRRGDLVIHAMDAFAGAIGVADSDGKGSPVYSVCKAKVDVNPYYYAYIVREMARSRWIIALARGIRERSTDFRFEGFATQTLPLPTMDEQSAIVHFLDHVNARVRHYVRIKRRLITLLNEQRQVLVHRTLTQGIQPGVALKSTGNRWFPEIPSNWDLVPLRRLIRRAVDGPHHSPQYIDEGISFLSARNIKVDRWSLSDVKHISETDFSEFSKRVVPERGDVLYTKGGTTGVARAVDLDFRFQVWVHVAVLKLQRQRVDPQYLALVLNSPRCYEQAQLYTRGATNQDLGLNRMKDIVLPAPSLAEQGMIVEALNRRLSRLRACRDILEQGINMMSEYRTRLVTDVVTGKLDVREAAVTLPDELDETPVFDTAEMSEGEETGDEALEAVEVEAGP